MKEPHPPFSCVSAVCFRREKDALYCLWYSDEEKDAFFLKGASLRTFPTREDAWSFLESLSDPPSAAGEKRACAVYDTRRIQRMLRGELPFAPSALLDFWNITGDLTDTLALPFLGSPGDILTEGVYEKLLCASGLPALRLSERRYIPRWSPRERERLRAVMEEGIRLIEGLPGPHSPPEEDAGSSGLPEGGGNEAAPPGEGI